jgi:hypothetical protein
MENKLYVAKYSSGSYDDYYSVSVFVSDDKEFVQKWVEKFNTKLEYWKEYFKQFGDESFDCKVLDSRHYNISYYDRFYQIMECNKAFIDEIEYRNPRKKETE